MRLRRVQADGFLSFDGFDLPFESRISTVVGPNGHGKSNLGHVLRCVYTAVASADRDSPEIQATLATYLTARRFDSLAAAEHLPAQRRGLRLQIDIELTSARERALITTFIRAVIVHQLVGNTSGYNIDAINAWAAATVNDEQLVPLHQLSLIVDHAGYTDSPWQVAAAFNYGEVDGSPGRYEWMLRGSSAVDEIARASDFLGHAIGHNPAPSATVAAQVIGGDRRDGQEPQTPVDDFTFAHLLPEPDVGSVRCALDLGGMVSPHTRAFTDAIGIDVRGDGDNNRHIGFSRILRLILDEALTASDDERLATPSNARQLTTDPRSMATTERLAERLLRLKNSGSANRAPFDRITQRFAALSNGRQVDVTLVSQQNVDGGQHRVDVDGAVSYPALVVSVQQVPASHRGAVSQVPIEFAGAGAGEALLLACTLEAPEDAVVFLDEPGATLHPTAQRQLSAYLNDSDAQFVVVTHSPYLIPYADPDQTELCRMQLDQNLRSVPWRIDSDLLRRLGPKIVGKGNQGLPFAAGVVLCEGQSDVSFLTALAHRLGLTPEEANVLIVDCGSRDNQPDYIAFLIALGIRHLVVMDGDATKAAAEPSVAKAAQAVREQVANSALATLVEFPEDLETTLGVSKSRSLDLAGLAATVDLHSGPVLTELAEHLCALVTGEPVPIALSRLGEAE